MSVNSAAGTTGRTARQEQTVFGIFGSLLRRKSWVLLPTFLAFALALGYVISTPPAYRAEATLLVEPQETPFTRPQSSDSTERLAIDREAVASQVQVIKSLDVANLVIDELKLMELPEFNPALRPAGILDIVTSLLGSGASKDDERKAVLREYFEHLTVYPVNETRVITIAFWSHDDELSAAAANAIANAYLKVQRDNTARATTDARGWLERQITDLRARVAEAERAVELYRTEKGLFAAAREPGDAGQPAMTIQAQQLAELSTQLSQARAQRSDAQARARLIRELMERGQAAEAREVSGSGLIQRLQEERVRRASQIAELSTTLLPAHPRMKELNAQVRNLDQQIRNEIEKIVGGLENDAAVAAARELQIEKNIEQLKSSVALANESEVELRALEREAKAQRDLLSAYLTRYREAAARSDNAFAPAFARVISPATVPLKPYFPSKLGIPLLATIGAFIVSAGVVITLELASAYSMLPQARLGPAAVPAGQEGRTREQATPVQPEAVPGQGIVSDFDAVSPPAPPVRTARADSGPKRECARAARAVQPGTAETTPGQAGTQAHAQAPQKANVAPQAASGAASPAADAGEQSVSAAMRRAAALFARSHPELQGGEEADARSEPAPAKPPAGAAVSEAMQVRESSRAEPAPADATSADLTFENVMVVTSIGEQGVCFQTALLHARQSAAKGLRVILVDTTEGPDGAETLGPDVPAQGYYDLVEERAQFAEVMFRDPDSSLHLIAAGRATGAIAPDSPLPQHTLEALSKAYDLVVVASQAVYSASLVSYASEVAVVCPDEVPDELAEEFAQMLRDVTAGDVAIVAPEEGALNADGSLEGSVA